MKYLRNRESFNNVEKVEEKWYHNLLAGLMLFNPTIGSMAQSLQSVNNQNKIELTSQEDDVLNDIKSIIDHVKKNKKEFKNSERIVNQLEKLIKQYERGELDAESMNKIAKNFVEEARDMKNPMVRTKSKEVDFTQRTNQDENWGQYSKINTVVNYDTLITEEQPTEIYVNIYEEAFFTSGGYDIPSDSNTAKAVNDTLNVLSNKGYRLEGVVVESSTDGQGLSQNLKDKLESDGYLPSNEGLSEIRNDKMKESLIKKTDIDTSIISQDIKWTDNKKIIDPNLRYNRVVLKLVLKEEAKKVEVSKNVVNVYYRTLDYKKKHTFDINPPKVLLKKKFKGKKLNLDKDRYENCFFIPGN